MENRTRNIVMSILFITFVITLIVVGYIYVKDLSLNPKQKEKEVTEKLIDYRLDKEKDYIYFENEEIVSLDPELTYSDVYLNIEGADIINSTLKSEMDILRKTIVKLDDTNKDETKELLYEETEVYSATERNYITYESGDYYSLVINDIEFNCYDDFLTKNLKGYVIDSKKGSILSNEELLNKYSLTKDDIIDRVSLRLDETQNVNEGIEVINKEETLKTLFDNYALYIESKDIYMTFIVKSNFINYNDSVKLN